VRDVQLHPDDRDRDPELHAEMVRDVDGERLYLEWVTDTGWTMVHLISEEMGEEDRLLSLDVIELPQAVRAFDTVLQGDSSTAPIRNMGVFERVWLEGEDGYVTLVKEEVQEPAGMLVLEQSEAETCREIIESIVDELDDVEDEPYV